MTIQDSADQEKIFTYWHSLFHCSLEEVLRGKKYQIESELALTKLPIKPDFVVTLDAPSSAAGHPILQSFRKFNTIKFTSPAASLRINDFKRGLVYVMMHQIRKNPKDFSLQESTLTFVSTRKPIRTFSRLRNIGFTIINNHPIKGVFQLQGAFIPVQFVVLNKMDELELMYPFAPFVSSKIRKEALTRLVEEAMGDPKNKTLRQIIDYSLRQGVINKTEWEGVYGMEKIPVETQKILDSMRCSWVGEQLAKEAKEETVSTIVKNGLANGVAISLLTLLTGYSEEDILKMGEI